MHQLNARISRKFLCKNIISFSIREPLYFRKIIISIVAYAFSKELSPSPQTSGGFYHISYFIKNYPLHVFEYRFIIMQV